MADLVDLTGKPVEPTPDDDIALTMLKTLVAQIEAGSIKPDAVYVLVEHTGDGVTRRLSRDSGISVSHGVFMLEMEKARLLNLMMG